MRKVKLARMPENMKKASPNFRTSLQYTQKQKSIEKESFSAFESENMIQKVIQYIIFFFQLTLSS